MTRLRVAMIFGGKSTEHEISILSVKSILKRIDRDKYDLKLIKIDINGNWFLLPGIEVDETPQCAITLIPANQGADILDISNGSRISRIDIAFPVLHGVFGEDGTIQGLFKMLNLAYVGCGVFASAGCMDKDFTKRILRDADIPVAPYVTLTKIGQLSFEDVDRALGAPLFIKPASLGSSVGIKKVNNQVDFEKGLEEAFKYDQKVIVEPNIEGREIECAVLGNQNPKASLPGEVVTASEFYTFESKYVDKDDASIQIPANIPEHQIALVRETAIKAFKALNCEVLARVDFFITNAGELVVNEINTIPGFTEISMYPKMWEATGISYKELLDHLIDLGLERHQQEQSLTVVSPESL